MKHETGVPLLCSLVLFAGSLLPLAYAGVTDKASISAGMRGIPIPDTPVWKETPQNVTLEYGDRLLLQVNLSQGVGLWWFVNDEYHFSITQQSGATWAIIKDKMILPIGVYYLKITVWDSLYTSLTAEIYIHVVDTHFPRIDGPTAIEFIQREAEVIFDWTCYDENPSDYVITLNGNLLEQGNWTNSPEVFTVHIGHLRPGYYVYRIVVRDIGNNTAIASVLVHVIENPNVEPGNTAQQHQVTSIFKQFTYVPAPTVPFIAMFAVIAISGLAAFVILAAVATRGNEFGFS
jgi:hypothetical protein